MPTIYAAYALYDFLVPGTAFVLLGIGRARDARAPRCCTGRRSPALGLVGAFVTPLLVATDAAELLGALHLSRGRHRGRVRARARAAVALARDHGGRLRLASGCCPASTTSASRRWRRTLFHVVAGFALVAALIVVRPVLRAGCRARRDRSGLVRRARAPICFGAAAAGAGEPARPVALTAFVAARRRDRRDRLAHRSRGRRRAGRRRARRARDRCTGRVDIELRARWSRRPGPAAARARAVAGALSARISRSASASRRCSARRLPRAGPLAARRSSPMLWAAAAVVRAARRS